jgi:hypothetical protein
VSCSIRVWIDQSIALLALASSPTEARTSALCRRQPGVTSAKAIRDQSAKPGFHCAAQDQSAEARQLQRIEQ